MTKLNSDLIDLVAACIGGAVRDSNTDGELRGIDSVKERFLLELVTTNPKFDQDIFEQRITYWSNQ